MALNPNTIKALFGHLAPAARLMEPHGTNQLLGLSNDLSRLSKYVQKQYASGNVAPAVKNAMAFIQFPDGSVFHDGTLGRLYRKLSNQVSPGVFPPADNAIKDFIYAVREAHK